MIRYVLLVFGVIAIASTSSSGFETRIDGKEVDVPVCGGIAGLVCDEDQWCDFPDEAVCGVADYFGTCRDRPDFCPEIYLPVCGCDGRTHGNACKAAAAGQDVAYEGECKAR